MDQNNWPMVMPGLVTSFQYNLVYRAELNIHAIYLQYWILHNKVHSEL